MVAETAAAVEDATTPAPPPPHNRAGSPFVPTGQRDPSPGHGREPPTSRPDHTAIAAAVRLFVDNGHHAQNHCNKFNTPFATRCSNLVVVRFVAPALPS